MKIIFAGTPSFAATALSRLIDDHYNIAGVYTQPDRPSGRGQKTTQSAVKQLATKYQLPIFQPVNFKGSIEEGQQAINELKALAPDLMIVAAYGLLLPPSVLEIPTLGCLNIHASLLPKWRGAAPIQRSIMQGDTVTGITIMQMNAGLDTGDVLYKCETNVELNDTSEILHERLAAMGANAITQVLQNLSYYQSHATAQDNTVATYAHKLSKAEAQINWQLPANHIIRQINGLQPWPVAWTTLKQSIRVWAALPLSQQSTASAGEIIDVSREGVTVTCGNQECILLTSLQWPGGSKLSAQQIWQSQKISTGDRFEYNKP